MAKKKFNPLEQPPSATSSDEEMEEISDDSSAEEEDELMNPFNTPSTKKPKTPSAAVIRGKPSTSAAVSQFPGLDPGSENPKTNKDRPAAKSGKKRSTSTETHAKRARKVSGEEDTKKPSFPRLWSEADEISLLQGMIDFKADTGKSPYEDMHKFYESAVKSICFEASRTQFTDKIRMLKRKYMVKGNKEVESYSKPHDQECMRLAKFIWGPNGMALESAVKPKKSEKKKLDSLDANGTKEAEEEEEEDKDVLVNNGKKVEEDKEVLRGSDWFENSFLVGTIASFGVDEYSVKQRWSNVAVETKKRMEDKWKLLQAKEFGLVLQKADFLREVSSLIAEEEDA